MKLHIGCGDKILKGFINVDIRPSEGVDVVKDIKDLYSFKDKNIELIYCSHVLEHFNRYEYINILKNWYDVLSDGGILRLAVPDIESVCNHYLKYKDLKILRGFLWGGQTYPQNYHYCGWDFETLKNDLIDVGFSDVQRYDWRNTEHSNIDDFSQCYLPHLDKDNGMLMSLNVEAKK
jgi:predicted SAM-dependent methyltransferase